MFGGCSAKMIGSQRGGEVKIVLDVENVILTYE